MSEQLRASIVEWLLDTVYGNVSNENTAIEIERGLNAWTGAQLTGKLNVYYEGGLTQFIIDNRYF